MNDINSNTFERVGLKIRCLRKLKKISQIRLAEIANLNFNYIGQIERAETNPLLKTLVAIANALEVEIKELFIFSILSFFIPCLSYLYMRFLRLCKDL